MKYPLLKSKITNRSDYSWIFHLTIKKNYYPMKFVVRSILSTLLLFASAISSAQNSQVLYFMNLPQNHLLNPAFRPTNSIYVGIPGLTGFNLNVTNNFFNFSDVFSKGLKISKSSIPFLDPNFDRDKFLGRIKKLNYLEPKVSVQLLGVGITAGKDLYVFLDIIDNAEVNLVCPRDLIRLAFLGNEEFVGQTLDLSAIKADVYYYREIGVGASKYITPKLRFGAKAKLLSGIAGGSLQNYGLDLTVNSDYSNTLYANMAIDISAPVDFIRNSDGGIEDVQLIKERFDPDNGKYKSIFNMRNAGFGLDLGAEYTVTDKLVFSAAITDIGFIRWKSDISNLVAYADIELRGLDFQDIYEGSATIDDLTKNMADSISNAFQMADVRKPFTTKLPVGLSFGGQYIFTDKFSAGILSYSRIIGQQVKEALTLSGKVELGDVFSATLAYTMCNHYYNNLGLGLSARAGFAQFYFLFDKVPLKWSRAGTKGDSIVLPAKWNTINTRFGINLVFGNGKNKSRDRQE